MIARGLTVIVIALAVVLGSQWHSAAQDNATLEDRVAELEAAVADLQAQAIRPATVGVDDNGFFTDLSALDDPEQTYFSICRQMPIGWMLAPEAYETLPDLQFNPRTPNSTSPDGFVALGCIRVE